MPRPAKKFVERLFAEHQSGLLAFFSRRVRAKADARDLAQEVYLRLLRVSDVDAIRNPEAYLYAVAGNLAKEHALLESRDANAMDVDQATDEPQLRAIPTFDTELDANRRLARLRNVLGQLSPKCRAVVILQYHYELSYQEIAERLGISANMVKKYLAHALIHCRKRMVRHG